MKFKELYSEPSRNGLTKPSSIRGAGVKFCNMGELFANAWIFDIPMDRVPVNDRERSQALLKEGDLLFARQSLVREGAGKCSVVVEVREPTTFDSHIIRVRLNRELANPYYYQYYFSSSLSPIPSIITQCAQSGIRGSDLAELDVLHPSLDEQNRIVHILSAYDALIENNRKQIKLLEEAAQRLYKEWFVDFRFPGYETTPINPTTNLPEGWSSDLLVNHAFVQYGYPFNSDYFSNSKNGIPIVRIRNIPHGFSRDYTTESFDPKYRVFNGDLLVGMDGDFYINTWAGGEAALVQRSCKIMPSPELNVGYLRWALKSQLEELQNGIVGSTVAHLGKKHIDAIRVIIPNLDLLTLFEKLERAILKLRSSNRLLSEARDRLLPKLMAGELEV